MRSYAPMVCAAALLAVVPILVSVVPDPPVQQQRYVDVEAPPPPPLQQPAAVLPNVAKPLRVSSATAKPKVRPPRPRSTHAMEVVC
jgi:hypothetical protein